MELYQQEPLKKIIISERAAELLFEFLKETLKGISEIMRWNKFWEISRWIPREFPKKTPRAVASEIFEEIHDTIHARFSIAILEEMFLKISEGIPKGISERAICGKFQKKSFENLFEKQSWRRPKENS